MGTSPQKAVHQYRECNISKLVTKYTLKQSALTKEWQLKAILSPMKYLRTRADQTRGEEVPGGPGPPNHKERKHVLPQYIIQKGREKTQKNKRFERPSHRKKKKNHPY
jgi:hypothetical protein